MPLHVLIVSFVEAYTSSTDLQQQYDHSTDGRQLGHIARTCVNLPGGLQAPKRSNLAIGMGLLDRAIAVTATTAIPQEERRIIVASIGRTMAVCQPLSLL